MRSPADSEGPDHSSSSCAMGCLAVALLFLVLVAGAAWWFFNYGRDFFTDLGRDALTAVIERSELEAEEKAALTAEIDRLGERFKTGEISGRQMADLVAAIGDSPLPAVIGIEAARAAYLAPSGLDAVEKAEGVATLRRIAYGAMQERLPEDALDEAFAIIEKEGSTEENRRIKTELTDEELRDFLQKARTAADEAGIPDEVPAVDLVGELRAIIERVLGKPDEDARQAA